MRAALLLALGSFAACNLVLGNEEGTLDADAANGGEGGKASGGKAGSSSSGNTANRGGSSPVIPGAGGEAGDAGNAGGGGNPAPIGKPTKLGAPCTSSSACNDSAAPGLICITPTQALLNGGAPPKGLCTAACAPEDANACAAFGDGALCWVPDTETPDEGYCVEACAFGAPPAGTEKCHGRAEFACNPAFLNDREEACGDNTDCAGDETCLSGSCQQVVTACLPSCRGDIDCAANMYCDQSFLGGVCVKTEPSGLPLGSPCTVQDEPDECLGVCQDDGFGSGFGYCVANCPLGFACGYNSFSGLFDGACLTHSIFSEATSTGDFGFCTPTCSCTDDCYSSGGTCQLPDGSELDDTLFANPGVCLDPTLGYPELLVCGGDGA